MQQFNYQKSNHRLISQLPVKDDSNLELARAPNCEMRPVQWGKFAIWALHFELVSMYSAQIPIVSNNLQFCQFPQNHPPIFYIFLERHLNIGANLHTKWRTHAPRGAIIDNFQSLIDGWLITWFISRDRCQLINWCMIIFLLKPNWKFEWNETISLAAL